MLGCEFHAVNNLKVKIHSAANLREKRELKEISSLLFLRDVCSRVLKLIFSVSQCLRGGCAML